ncbi:tyrosine-protein phosphatase [Sulfitobacter sp. F26169L]|uniref:tyrosine-protein phosphatase n=1 Tax=Sulfitobacter sp. F26169L TaxID=2996015 RepID=UPI0022608FCD|nr:tyrosine-protein phosphatase [Sulfitobacter sp. F26169L]MCX7568135.1 tyrosine-protein phosphatase [Sulfitobacter sp. F26169L]
MNTPLPSRQIVLRGAHNVRDLGGYLTAQGTPVPMRRFLRGDCLHRLDDGEPERLHFEGLRMVVDLRTAREVRDAPSRLARQRGVEWVNLPLFDALSPAALAEVEVPEGHPLLAMYITAIETRGAAIRTILSRISTVRDGAVLFNCTAGKDRTGIIAALLLGLAGVSHTDIISDYALTEQFIPELVSEFLSRSRANGGDVEAYAALLESPASAMAGMMEHLDAQYGSVMGYLDHIEIPTDVLSRLQVRLGVTG